MPDGFMNVHRAEVVAIAARYRVPTVYPWRYFTELGGLLSYGNEQRDSFRLAATYAEADPMPGSLHQSANAQNADHPFTQEACLARRMKSSTSTSFWKRR
jgi:hypothetical protein